MNQKPSGSSMDLSEIMRLARSPAGQELIALLQQQGGRELQEAMDSAASGNYGKAKDTISAFLSDPKAKALMEKLGRE